jgi:hypothetical protein
VKKRPTIIQALDNPQLLGHLGIKAGTSWDPWRTILKAVYGLPLNRRERDFFVKVTGRSTYNPPVGGWRRILALSGRQVGKSTIAGAVQAYETSLPMAFAPGVPPHGVLVSQDARGVSDVMLANIRRNISGSPTLGSLVGGDTQERLTLRNNVVVATYPCRPEAVRGPRALVVVLDEVCHFRAASDPDKATDREVVRAASPMLRTTKGKLFLMSSPGGEYGVAYEWHRDYWGDKGGHKVLVIQADSLTLNPSLDPDELAADEALDPEGARAEIYGLFRTASSRLLDPKMLALCTLDVAEIAPRPGVRYYAFVDVSGGRNDEHTMGIGHTEGTVNFVDYLEGWRENPPSVVVAAIADRCRRYGITGRDAFVTGDAYAAEWVVERFKQHGLRYEVSKHDESKVDKSRIYLEAMHVINEGAARLPDHAEMLRQFRNLVRKPRSGTHDAVDHPAGAHDDLANAAAGVLWKLAAMGAVEPTGFSVWSHTKSWAPRVTGQDGYYNLSGMHPDERPAPPETNDADQRMGKTKAAAWRSAWTSDGGAKLNSAEQLAREDRNRGGRAHCACGIVESEGESIYYHCYRSMSSGAERIRRGDARDYKHAVATGWTPQTATTWQKPAA